jgi:hypothetical protein
MRRGLALAGVLDSLSALPSDQQFTSVGPSTGNGGTPARTFLAEFLELP